MLVLCLCCVCALGVPAAPSVVCMSRAWHPNIDLHTGYVSLPILNKDWRPVLSINTVVFALQVRTKSYLVWHQYQVPVLCCICSKNSHDQDAWHHGVHPNPS